ncbi:MAG: hypothetical protein HC837_15005 [Chloroflexaceae bacterium]|nr:hypothetical protein [Chloroflexaceae bacterium]
MSIHSSSERKQHSESCNDQGHRNWTGILRRAGGWFCIVLGVLTIWWPIPVGLPLIVVGVMLVGLHSPEMERTRSSLERGLRQASQSSNPVLRWVGHRGLRIERQASREIEQEEEQNESTKDDNRRES